MDDEFVPALTLDRMKTFWEEINAVLENYPEILDGIDGLFGDGSCTCGYEAYDPSSPKLYSGVVLVLGLRNLQNYETMLVMKPIEQSDYMTAGLILHADKMVG